MAGRSEQLWLRAKTIVEYGHLVLGWMVGRYIWPSDVAAGREPATDKIRTAPKGYGNCDHDVSVSTGSVSVGWWRGQQPRSKISMIIIRPAQQGHGWSRVGRSSALLVFSSCA